MLTIWGEDTLPEAFPTIFIYLREVMRHSTNNGYPSFGHSVTFPRLISCPKLVILLEICEPVLVEKTLC